LGIDSSTPLGSVALLEHNQIISERSQSPSSGGSRSILALIDQVLTESDLTIEKVDGFCLTVGPGSFTGLRVGVSLVKGMVLAAGKPFVPVDTLEAQAFTVAPCGQPICSLLDARKKQVYAAQFGYDGDRIRRRTEDAALFPEDLVETIQEPMLFVGQGLDTYGEWLSRHLGSRFQRATHLKPISVAAAAALLADAEFESRKSCDLNSLVIHYARKPEAEFKINKSVVQQHSD